MPGISRAVRLELSGDGKAGVPAGPARGLVVGQSGESLVSVTSFLWNETYWQTLLAHVKDASHVDAAIAYFGQGGAKRLPLRRGDRLIVDMSQATVKTGGTDPREVEKLIRRGVKAFTRRNLHAKIVVADEWVIAGSANVSKHSEEVLDEAAILTNSQSAVRRAREFIDRLCTEPIRREYLEKCKELYKPPKLSGERTKGERSQQRARHAKLWIVKLNEESFPESEWERHQQGEAEARKRTTDEAHGETDIQSFWWPHKPKMADELELGDRVITVTKAEDKTISVDPPGVFLYLHRYVRDPASGKERFVFYYEIPEDGESMPWEEFHKVTRSLLPTVMLASPRTMPIRDIQVADDLLRLWTPDGLIPQR